MLQESDARSRRTVGDVFQFMDNPLGYVWSKASAEDNQEKNEEERHVMVENGVRKTEEVVVPLKRRSIH